MPNRMQPIALLASAVMVAPLLAESPPAGCTGSSSLGTYRILVRHSAVGLALPIKSVSIMPVGSRLIWDPVHLPRKQEESTEVTAILVPVSGDDLVVLEPHKARSPAEWEIPTAPAAIAIVVGPQGLSAGKVRSLVAGQRQLVEQLANYAEQTSKVEGLVQELSDAEQSGGGMDAALQGFSARYGVALPRIDTKASGDQQASLLLKALLPAAGSYDPLAGGNAQMQQSGGLAASVAGLFFGNAVGLAAGGTAFLQGIKGAFFPGTEFRSAFAQNDDHDGLALCTKAPGQKARTHVSYLWAYRLPNLQAPAVSLAGAAYLPMGVASAVGVTSGKGSSVKQLERARDWRLVPLAGGKVETVPVAVASPNAISLDLTHSHAQPGDYKLEAFWDWDPLDLRGTIHLCARSDFSHVRLTTEAHDQLIEGKGVVGAQLTGADFEFLEKASISKSAAHSSAPAEVKFVLPLGKRAGEQKTVTLDIDTAARGDYLLTLTQSGGSTHEMPLTILPPNPVVAGLPAHVNLNETAQPLVLEGTGLDRIESVSSPAGEIQGSAGTSGWAGSIRLKPDARAGDVFAMSLKVKGLDAPLTVPGAIRVFGPRPAITAVKESAPAALGLAINPDELPSGTAMGFAVTFRWFHDASNTAEVRPRLELGCQSGGLRKALSLSPDEHVSGVQLSAAAPGMLFLTIDPGTVGYPGCLLTAAITAQPEGRSDPFTVGRIVRVPHLDQFILTSEQLGPSTYVGILKGHDLDVIEKTGWDARQGLAVDGVPSPVPGDPSVQTMRIALPWPAPAPHAPLYVWLRGEGEGRKTAVTY